MASNFKYRQTFADLYRIAEKYDTMQNTAEEWIALRKDAEEFLHKYEEGTESYAYAQNLLSGLFHAIESKFVDE